MHSRFFQIHPPHSVVKSAYLHIFFLSLPKRRYRPNLQENPFTRRFSPAPHKSIWQLKRSRLFVTPFFRRLFPKCLLFGRRKGDDVCARGFSFFCAAAALKPGTGSRSWGWMCLFACQCVGVRVENLRVKKCTFSVDERRRRPVRDDGFGCIGVWFFPDWVGVEF